MSEHNPYAPPSEKVGPTTAVEARDEEILATRLSRLVAAIIDGLLLMVVVVPLQFAAGVYEGFPEMVPMTTLQTLMWSGVSFVALLLVHGYFLATRAQSIGKIAMGIKIVDLAGHDADFRTIVLRRILPVSVASAIPYAGGIFAVVDAVAIFGRDRRCVHDLIANTRVVKTGR